MPLMLMLEVKVLVLRNRTFKSAFFLKGIPRSYCLIWNGCLLRFPLSDMSYSCLMRRTSLGLRFGGISTFFPPNSTPSHTHTHTHTHTHHSIIKIVNVNSRSCFIDYFKALDCVDHNKLWKILKEMGIPDHLTCLLRNLYAGQEARVRTRHGTSNWFQIGNGAHQCCLFQIGKGVHQGIQYTTVMLLI